MQSNTVQSDTVPPSVINQQSPSAPKLNADSAQSLEPVTTQEQSLPQEELFLLPRSAWARPVTRLRVLMQVKRLLDRQEAEFNQSKG